MAEEEKISKEFLYNLVESMEGGVLTIDKNSRITFFNRSAEEITGFTREEVLGKKCFLVTQRCSFKANWVVMTRFPAKLK